MKTRAQFILCDNRGVVYEVRNRDHSCRIEFKDKKIIRWYDGNPIPLADALDAVNDVLRARHIEYVEWCARNKVSDIEPLALYSA